MSSVCTSTDGLTWSDETDPGVGLYPQVLAANVNTHLFCALPSYGGSSFTSSDGLAWTENSNATPEFLNFHSMANNGTVFCAFADDGKAYVSTTGTAWVGYEFSGATYGFLTAGGGIFVAVTSTTAFTSTDGQTWTATDLTVPAWPDDFYWTMVTYQDGLFIVIGNMGEYAASANGTAWTSYAAIEWGNGAEAWTKIASAGGTSLILADTLAAVHLALPPSPPSPPGAFWTRLKGAEQTFS